MSFNVRVNTPSDGADAWPRRRDSVASVVRLHDPALVGCQEVLRGQLADLQSALPAYEWIGVGRRDGATEGEHVPIGYDPGRLECQDHGTFWLSPDPAAVGSVGWDAEHPRIATWASFRDRTTGRGLLHVNTHLDHGGARARLEGARLVLERIASLATDGVTVLTGVFNASPTSPPYDELVSTLEDAQTRSRFDHHGPTGTFHGFDGDPGARIDYVFVDGLTVHQHAHLADHWDGRYPSDHFPVIADVRPIADD
jgi:endonuclease/exonuclease/phosphatase family metal-dependent hydrolase